MTRRARLLPLLAALLSTVTLCEPAFAGPPDPRPIDAITLGFNVAKAISTGFLTDAIDMKTADGSYTKLSAVFAITWGTTTSMEVRLLGSDTLAGTYSQVAYCTASLPHACDLERYTFASATWSGVTPRLDFRSTRPRFLKIQIVAGAGNGTVSATVTRAP